MYPNHHLVKSITDGRLSEAETARSARPATPVAEPKRRRRVARIPVEAIRLVFSALR